MFGWVSKIQEAIRLLKIFGAAAVVVGGGIAGVIWSPFFRTFFLGVAVGGALLFGLEFSSVFSHKTEPQICINPKVDPNGPVKRCWHSTDSRGFGFWGECDEPSS
jgi:hypothetical protein